MEEIRIRSRVKTCRHAHARQKQSKCRREKRRRHRLGRPRHTIRGGDFLIVVVKLVYLLFM